MFSFSFLSSAISELDLGVLKMLINVSFHDVLQPGVYQFVTGMHDMTLSQFEPSM